MENNYDDTIPLQYINNENPYAFCADYHRNSINLPEKKNVILALQRMQPSKINFRMPQKHLEKEKEFLLENAIKTRRMMLYKKGLSILNVDYHDNPEFLFEQYTHIDEIVDVLVDLKKLNLMFHQKRLRAKVAVALNSKLPEDIEYKVDIHSVLEEDNLKDALIFCKLEDLYGKESRS